MELLLLELAVIDGTGFHLVATIEINGKPARMTVDTGASDTIFDHDSIIPYLESGIIGSHVELTTFKSQDVGEVYGATIRNLILGGISFNDYNAKIINIAHINKAYERNNIEPIVGLIGSDLLYRYNCKINYETLTLTI